MSVAVFVSDCLPLPSLRTRAMGIPWRSVAKTWAFTVVDPVLIPALGSKIPQATWCGETSKQPNTTGKRKPDTLQWAEYGMDHTVTISQCVILEPV